MADVVLERRPRSPLRPYTVKATPVGRFPTSPESVVVLVKLGYRVVGYDRAGDEYVPVVEFAGEV